MLLLILKLYYILINIYFSIISCYSGFNSTKLSRSKLPGARVVEAVTGSPLALQTLLPTCFQMLSSFMKFDWVNRCVSSGSDAMELSSATSTPVPMPMTKISTPMLFKFFASVSVFSLSMFDWPSVIMTATLTTFGRSPRFSLKTSVRAIFRPAAMFVCPPSIGKFLKN